MNFHAVIRAIAFLLCAFGVLATFWLAEYCWLQGKPKDVKLTPSTLGRSVIFLILSPERSLGPILTPGVCVNLWNAGDGSPLDDIFEVVAVLPTGSDGRRGVYLATTPEKV